MEFDNIQFSERRQTAVIGAALQDRETLKKLLRLGLKPGWFNHALLGRVFRAVCSFDETHQRLPLLSELREHAIIRQEERACVEKMLSIVSELEPAAREYPKDALLYDVTDWARSRKFYEAVTKAEKLYNSGKFEAAYDEMGRFIEWRNADQKQDLPDALVQFSVSSLLTDPPDRRWIWRHRIPRQPGAAGVLAAPGASGKTSLLTGLVVARALRREFLGEGIEAGATLIVSAEEGPDEYLRKFAAWRTVLPDFDAERVCNSVRLLDLTGREAKMILKDRNVFSVNQALVEDLAQAAQRTPGCDLIILETTSRLCPDESNEAMSAFVVACEMLARLSGTVVLTVAHVAKSVGRANVADQYVSRGGSALSDNARFVLSLARFPEEAAAQRAEFGLEIGEEAAEDLMVLRGVKVNGCARQDPTPIKKIPTSFGMVFGPVRLEDEAEILERVALEVNVDKLTRLVRKETDAGEYVTVGRLKLQQSKGGYMSAHGIHKDKIEDVVDAAIAQGYLTWGPSVPKGGPTLLLAQKPSALA